MQRLFSKLQRLQQTITFIPYIYATIGNILLVFMQICLKLVIRTISAFSAIYIRGFFLLIINTIIIRMSHTNVYQTDKATHSLVIKRSVLNSFSMVFLLMAIPYLPIGIANSLFNVGPLIVFYLQSVYYKKDIDKLQFALTFVCFIGVLLIIKPPFLFGNMQSSFQYIMIFPLMAAFCNASSMFYLHLLKGKVSNLVTLQHVYLAQVFITSISQNFEQVTIKQNLNYQFFLALVGLVIFAYTMQNTLSYATLLKKASYTMPFGYISIVVASICDIIIFQLHFDWISVIGMLMTSTGLLSKLLLEKQ